MNVPLEISYRDIERSDVIDNIVNGEVTISRKCATTFSSCRVSIERPQKHIKSGSPYRVRIDVTGSPRARDRFEAGTGPGRDARGALDRRDHAFDGARRQVKELSERQDKDVKRNREPQVNAIVEAVYPEQGYGFLKTLEGRDVYFHRNSVLNRDFERLTKGTGRLLHTRKWARRARRRAVCGSSTSREGRETPRMPTFPISKVRIRRKPLAPPGPHPVGAPAPGVPCLSEGRGNLFRCGGIRACASAGNAGHRGSIAEGVSQLGFGE